MSRTRNDQNGFAVVDTLSLLLIAIVLTFLIFTIWAQLGARQKASNDTIRAQSLTKARMELAEYATKQKTIPDSVQIENGITYLRKDNQKAELCATFEVPRNGANDRKTNAFEALQSVLSAQDSKIYDIYRDNADFDKHVAGRNCYVINYAPINEAYDEKYKGKKYNWNICDAYRGYASRFTGQTIKGFFIGGSFTTSPGTAGGRAVLAQDADAYDSSCRKIPISELKVGDKVEMYIEDGPKNGNEMTYFVKAIKKEF